jgi:hypothetical protein
MRTVKRLRFLYKFFKSKKNFKMYLRDIVGLESANEIKAWSDEFYLKFKNGKSYHKNNPHLRFSQILQDMGLHKIGFWYHIEDEAVLIRLGVEPREVLYWGNNLSKNNNRLKKTNWMLIKDMDTEHIKAVLSNNFTHNVTYMKCFINELKLRENDAL